MWGRKQLSCVMPQPSQKISASTTQLASHATVQQSGWLWHTTA
jgi:hypothetical protein